MALISLIVGISCLFFPERIQRSALDRYNSYKGLAKFNPFIDWMKTDGYIISLRLGGIIAMVIFIVAVIVLLKEMHR